MKRSRSPRRPDGTRSGERAFFDWMNGEKLSCCVDFDRQADELRRLLAAADVVLSAQETQAIDARFPRPSRKTPLAMN